MTFEKKMQNLKALVQVGARGDYEALENILAFCPSQNLLQ